tara:strand:- start:14459 stop:15307 length:849 start_codon:yes stop_codon:yes gene_type:complete
MSTYKDFLLKELSQGIINITFTDNLQVPYTTLSRNITQLDDIETVKVYNLITEKPEDLLIKNISSWCVDELCNNNYIEECKKDLDGIDEESAYKFYFNIITKQYKLFDSLKLFKFCLSPEEFISNHMSNQQLNVIKSPFINLVKFKINEIAVELDEIATTSEDDDLEDIKTIKEMFEECVSDIDFSNVKNITDLIDCWPPLLLPLPDSLENIKQCLLRVSPVEDSSEIKSDLEYIIQDNDNVSLLQEFLEVLEVNKNDIDIKKYNDSKNVIEKRLNILNDIT